MALDRPRKRIVLFILGSTNIYENFPGNIIEFHENEDENILTDKIAMIIHKTARGYPVDVN